MGVDHRRLDAGVPEGLKPGGPRPMRPDLTAADFVRLLEGKK